MASQRAAEAQPLVSLILHATYFHKVMKLPVQQKENGFPL
jgi:hypothetical protein